MPNGMTAPGEISLATTEEPTRRKAPAKAESGIRKRWSSPTKPRAICGATRPMKPIVPVKATAEAVSTDIRINIRNRIAPTFSPRLIEADRRMHRNKLAVALANKLARIAWAVLRYGREFDAPRDTVAEAI